ncbi:ATPase domain-containing protein [Halomonas lysinitropha]|uniref:Circadian clock protein kinase KaiC n=1 Tax=Halomonas lysinitropha TaxID=2607506 RepID=A0A5K1I6I6_9GAMM|nr:ATPase domain-containing protein [Halomonas lysinitropha]VVZ96001.1 Circadian clock protein kinase KaiC [Halomonas lysinitropha]
MNDTETTADHGLVKRPTGIRNLDTATHGGLPAGGATLVVGEPGCGKTIIGLQILASALKRGEGGIFMSFEESRDQILRHAEAFCWGPPLRESSRCEILDGQSMRHGEFAGAFDIEGLLAVLDLCVQRVAGSWIVLDGIDQLLRRQPDSQMAIDQIAQLNDWCIARGYSLLLTGKHTGNDRPQPDHLSGIEFMLSTILVLSSILVDKRLNRRFRIAKYRGTRHNPDELAMLIDDAGIHLPYAEPFDAEAVPAAGERLGTGIERLDSILDGGVYRGSITLVSGQPGTSKTTLGTAFAAAAARRGERALLISFDEFARQIVRNVATLGIDLQTPIDSGHLKVVARASWDSLVEEHYMALLALLDDFQPDCLVIDPASALLKSSGAESAFLALERLLAMTRTRGITTLLTSLSEADDPFSESSLSHASTLADTWIVLRYQINAGERNRSLSIVKSRGTGHSNQVREMLLTDQGVELADTYPFGSEVLMGTARLQKESEEEAARQHEARERRRRQQRLEREINKTRTLIQQGQEELERLQEEMMAEHHEHTASDHEADRHERSVLRHRAPDQGGLDQ